MAYSVGGKIEASDWNTFIASLNPAWGAGAGDVGYGQAVFPTVAVGDKVFARPATQNSGGAGTTPTWSTTPEWRTLVDTINNMSIHQIGGAGPLAAGTFTAASSLPVSAAAVSGLIAYSTALTGTLTTITGTQRLSASAQGGSASGSASQGSPWTDECVITFTVTWGSHDNARFFFNAGGQIKQTFTHPGGAGINATLSAICSDAGTMVISSTGGAPASITIAGTSFNGVTKIGGGGATTIATNSGFYGLGGLAQIYEQTGGGGTNLKVQASYGGGVMTIALKWTTVPNGQLATAGTGSTVNAVYPSTTYLQDTWGPVTITSTVGGICAAPVVGTITPNTYSLNVAYTGTITITNCTAATITTSGLPAGLTINAGAPSGANYVFTVSGTPTSRVNTTFTVTSATNAPGGCSPYTVTNVAAGTLIAPCATPTVIPITPSTYTPPSGGPPPPGNPFVYTPYTGTIIVKDATSATISHTGMITGLSIDGGVVSGNDIVFTVSGTPTVSPESTTFTVTSATNNSNSPVGCIPVTVTNLAAGTLSDGIPGCSTPVSGAITI